MLWADSEKDDRHDQEKLLSSALELDEDHDLNPPKDQQRYAIIKSISLGLSLALNAVLLYSHLFFSKSMNAAVLATSQYSPIFDTIPITHHTVQLNGTLFPPQPIPWSRLEPSPAATAAWSAFEPVHHFPISASQVRQLGKDPSTAARFSDADWHLGDDAYIASFDVFHQIHCLNELRQMTFADYPTSDSEDSAPPPQHSQQRRRKKHSPLWWIHLRHCTDMLVQNLICHADADLITYNWMDTQEHAYPDFSVVKQCRDFEALVRWRDEHRVDREKYLSVVRKPEGREEREREGIQVLEMEKGYYDMFGFGGSEIFPEGRNASERRERGREAEFRDGTCC